MEEVATPETDNKHPLADATRLIALSHCGILEIGNNPVCHRGTTQVSRLHVAEPAAVSVLKLWCEIRPQVELRDR